MTETEQGTKDIELAQQGAERATKQNEAAPPAATGWKAVIAEIFYSGDMKQTQRYLKEEAFRNKSIRAFILLVFDVIFRGIAQVFLCNNPVSGFLISIGLMFTSFDLFGYAFFATAISTLSAIVFSPKSTDLLFNGLLGYDGALVGCACYVFINSHYALGAAALFSSLCGFVRLATGTTLGFAGLPALTSAFNIVTVMLLFASHGSIIGIPMAHNPPTVYPSSWSTMSIGFFFDATFRGIGQFMFADTTHGGFFVWLGILTAGRVPAAMALMGSFLGWFITLYFFRAPASVIPLIRAGLYGYNCTGACVATAGGVFYEATDSAVFIGALASCLGALMTVGFKGLMGDIPVLTFPFIVTQWLVMLSRSEHLHPIGTGRRPWGVDALMLWKRVWTKAKMHFTKAPEHAHLPMDEMDNPLHAEQPTEQAPIVVPKAKFVTPNFLL